MHGFTQLHPPGDTTRALDYTTAQAPPVSSVLSLPADNPQAEATTLNPTTPDDNYAANPHLNPLQQLQNTIPIQALASPFGPNPLMLTSNTPA